MFKKATKKLADNIIIDAKATIKKEINTSIDKRMPLILGMITVGATLLAMIEPKKTKVTATSVTIINNYYFYK